MRVIYPTLSEHNNKRCNISILIEQLSLDKRVSTKCCTKNCSASLSRRKIEKKKFKQISHNIQYINMFRLYYFKNYYFIFSFCTKVEETLCKVFIQYKFTSS